MRGKTPPTDPLTARERRRLLIGTVVVAVILAVGVAAWVLFDRSPDYSRSENGCVTVQSAGPMGGQQQRACGDQALAWCRAEYAKQDAAAVRVQEQCRLAGILPSQ
ncbi:MAG: hypothetical protein JWN03_1336 [Nocardia sp.]|uniref:hypothetical protein n=1 Tax=Nocardia sp. TaxID=1821 RepID=UPI00261D2054|nr:hypothetical protein [Nocardia sp.]MCU1641061.1 hypothetical protein [Nocardia sp.]